MKKIFFILILVFIGCKKKDKDIPLTKEELVEYELNLADEYLADHSEKISLIALSRKIPSDSVYLIIRDYQVKTQNYDVIESEYIEKVVDTISRSRKMSKSKIASLIFSFKYEMLTKDEIEQNFIDDLQDQQNTEGVEP